MLTFHLFWLYISWIWCSDLTQI